ncbi:MAG: nuclear transport factor 2 family protein [Flavobacteriaceae bacterium]|nr:nuclear transport factor 2 family protein [Flavobacteriaceae bacterium]
MKVINEIWGIYRTCWNDTNSIQRTEKLQKILTDDFEYRDPNFEIKGYVQLSDYMKQFQEQFEGASFITTDINIHHNRCLVNWNMVNDKNEVVSNGTSFVLCENNKLKQITGFFKES